MADEQVKSLYLTRVYKNLSLTICAKNFILEEWIWGL